MYVPLGDVYYRAKLDCGRYRLSLYFTCILFDIVTKLVLHLLFS